MAYFKKRGQTWTYYIDLRKDPLNPQKRPQITKGGFKTKREAQSASRIIENEIENGTYVKESEVPFESFSKDWLKSYSHVVKPSSVREREKELKHFIIVWGDLPINRITKKMYEDRIFELSKKYSHNYVGGIHACGRMLFRRAIEFGYIKINPTENFRLAKPQGSIEDLEKEDDKIIFLEKEELAHYLKTAQTDGLDMDYLIFTVLSYTGLRIGELLALKWTDFDEIKGTLRITKTLYNPNNTITGYTLLTPKTIGSKRTISIDKELVTILKKHKIKQKETKLKNGKMYKDNGFIFSRDDGHPQLRKVVETRIKRLLKKTGIDKKITPHSFRHTHVSLLIESGANEREIMERLGHTDIRTTMNIYAHITKSVENETSMRFSRLMNEVLHN